MKKISLNHVENLEYYNKIVNVIPGLATGTYHFRDFFKGQVTSPRIARRFYEDVMAGVFPRISLVGTLSREGYTFS